ncbi:hypothetical protein [Rathayibacter toxicus]|uniref:hypothetical protein n=1 Tax=Rathayibacter toxicus TaxID=145458 RepID=UPI000CE86D67|nr:hypothetical protein [Rathayibacter toxicus]PPI56513.1 hypothetical protein C5D35_01480 [Rathayibacter toxicus]QOD10278.1 hypothetical protein BSG36_10280 [Rathayibacter toxicus]QWL28951.1 hypothetical protein E2R33_10300 [Rathayibacter toxicus]QWL33136.1 hypothetical protein E2R35_10090 [Rathayibacter toxicus]QWL35231.1 hypothetical protein E2R36_10090 [Rathayibacter toxicus]
MSSPAAQAASPDRGRSARVFLAQLRRASGDVVVWSFFPVALLVALALVVSFPHDLRTAPPNVVAELGTDVAVSLVSNLLVISAIMGALSVTLAYRTGVLARELVFGSAAVVFGARAALSVVFSLLFGIFSVAVLDLTFVAISERSLFSPREALVTMGVLGSAGLWGFLVGALLRDPLLVLFVVPATLMPALVLAHVVPAIADVLPLRAQLAAAGLLRTGLTAPIAGCVLLGWLIVATAVVSLVLRVRDRI